MKYLMLIAAIVLPFIPVQAHSSLEELMADMATKELEALRVYVDAHPGAGDLAEARQMLVYRLMADEAFDEALGHLEIMYREMPADKAAVELDAIGEVVIPTLQLYQLAGKTNELVAYIGKVREDFSTHEQAELIQSSLDEFVAMMSVDRPQTGETIELSFTAVDGREIDLASMTGKVVLVDFWATWCGPCIRAMPALKQLYADFHGKGFEIIGISLDNERGDLEEYIDNEQIGWPQYFDGKGWENELAARFGIESIPATYLIGPDGKIEAVNAGEDELRALVARLLAPPPAASAVP